MCRKYVVTYDDFVGLLKVTTKNISYGLPNAGDEKNSVSILP